MAVQKKLLYLLALMAGCTMPDEKKPVEVTPHQNIAISTADSNEASVEEPVKPAPPAPRVRQPKGVYHAVLPLLGGTDHTVAFYNDFTYQLQETYRSGKKDSVVVVKGNWAPSDGYIWLYKDQVVRARYLWKGEELQYYSPALKKGFSMQPMEDIMNNTAWKEKPKQGIAVFGIGNEPFWSVELNHADSVFFLLSDWSHPLRLKVDATSSTKDSVVYTAHNDSTALRLSVYPLFCSDGMSDNVYSNRIRVQYNQQVYSGCGVLYR